MACLFDAQDIGHPPNNKHEPFVLLWSIMLPTMSESLYAIGFMSHYFINHNPKSIVHAIYLKIHFTMIMCNSLGSFLNLAHKHTLNFIFGLLTIK